MVTNKELWHQKTHILVVNEIKRWRWNGFGLVLQRKSSNIAKISLRWNPQGNRPRRLENTWCKTVLDEMWSVRKPSSEIIHFSQQSLMAMKSATAICTISYGKCAKIYMFRAHHNFNNRRIASILLGQFSNWTLVSTIIISAILWWYNAYIQIQNLPIYVTLFINTLQPIAILYYSSQCILAFTRFIW